MTIRAIGRYALGVCASAILLAACSGRTLPVAAFQRAESLDATQTLALQAKRHVFVASTADEPPFGVTMYALQSNKLEHRIRATVDSQDNLLDDASGRLYVLNRKYNTIRVFGPKKQYVSYRIYVELPTAIALDASGNLYVATYKGGSLGSVEIFAPGSNTPERTITDGISQPQMLTFDALGDLFVANTDQTASWITMYAPGGSMSEETITDGVNNPGALATDSQGNLYVANLPQSGGDNVTMYSAGSYARTRTITAGVKSPASLILDSADNLYVGNGGNVTVYAPGSSEVLRTISTQSGSYRTSALLFDENGILYASFESKYLGGVNLYAPGSNTPMIKIRHKQSVRQPVAMAIGI